MTSDIDKGTSNDDISRIQKDEEEVVFDPESEDPLPKDKYGCFENFFPEVKVINRYLDDSSASNHLEIDSGPKIRSGYSEPTGCAFMRHYYKSENKISFEASVTIKNNSVGGIIGANGTGNRGDYLDLQYKVIFLNKNEDYGGKISNGYSGGSKELEDSIYIFDSINQGQSWIKTPSKENPAPISTYFGIWFFGGVGEGNILSKISRDRFEILRNVNYYGIFKQPDVYDRTWGFHLPIMARHYEPNKKGGVGNSKFINRLQTFTPGYVPFLKFKGWWINWRAGETICNSRLSGIEFTKHVKSLCANT